MFDEEAVQGVRDDLTDDDNEETTTDDNDLDTALAEKLAGEPSEDADDDENDDTEEPEDEPEEESDDDDADDEPQVWEVAGRKFGSPEEMVAYIEQQNQYILNTSKGEREAPAAPPPSPLTGLSGADRDSQYRSLPQQSRDVIDGALAAAFPTETDATPDYSALEQLATQLFHDNDLNSQIGIELSSFIWDTWANSSIENSRKANQHEMANTIAVLQAQQAIEDPALASVRAQHVAEEASALTRDKLGHLDEAGFEELGAWIIANRENYDESSVDFSSAQGRADLAEYYYIEMLKSKAATGGLPAATPPAKKRRANKDAASAKVKSGVPTGAEPMEDFKKAIMDADVNDGRFTWK